MCVGGGGKPLPPPALPLPSGRPLRLSLLQSSVEWNMQPHTNRPLIRPCALPRQTHMPPVRTTAATPFQASAFKTLLLWMP